MAAVAEGDVVWIRARVRAVHREQGLACIRISTPGSFGGPGFRQDVVPLTAIAHVEATPPDDDALVPRVNWRS